MQVEVWSDVVCPWCYIGKRRLEEALARFPHADEVEVVWRAFELDPSARSAAPGDAAREPGDYARRLAAKYGTSVEQGQGMVDSMTAAAAADGVEMRFDLAVAANTLDAHQVLHLAAERGLQDAAKERLLRGYFTEGEAVGDHEVLVRLAVDAGLDADEVRAVLAEGRYVDAVRAEEAEAAALGATGVPFFVVDRRYGVAGAQPAEQLLAVLQRAWDERSPLTLVGAAAPGAGAADHACGPEGCAI
ncbi:DsbA family oxidoreductase [uncultured Pseudokineococcus sp.]|uniref:DsbA family oxidoreductase n=1 Tax=uncultured Pseudokineococcus sp. TaxID=1642928 RepID=UPI00260AA4D1|nr:DsbA family oxidoreductase [uncultured Pseudokineococcus sp.]